MKHQCKSLIILFLFYSMHQEVKHCLEDFLNKGWITKSSSNYSSPVIAVRKKDGSLRLRCDYRALNNKSISDRHPLPRVQDAIGSLNGKKWFSLLDQQKGYHQIYLDQESCRLTAFITPWDLYQWVRVPFGLSNAPVEFQRYMENCLTDVRDKFTCPYLDNMLVYSDDFDSYVDHLLKVLQILRENGIKVKAKNCKLFQKQINYLSRTITDKGYAIDATNIKAVTDLFTNAPSSIGQLRRVLGLLGYYRRYVKGFSRIEQSLLDRLKKDKIESSSRLHIHPLEVATSKSFRNVNNSNELTTIVIIPRPLSTLYTSCRCFSKRFRCRIVSVQRQESKNIWLW